MSKVEHDQGRLVELLQNGDQQALADLFALHTARLHNLISMRLDKRVASRVDVDDVLQEVFLDASDRIHHYMNEHSGSIYVWLRLIAMQTIANVHRRHLGTKMRDAKRERSIHQAQPPSAASASLALQLLGQLTSPSQVAMREETAVRIERAIEGMSALDQEVLRLRHFEQLSNTEIAEVLDINKKAASIRYVRALKRLKHILEELDIE